MNEKLLVLVAGLSQAGKTSFAKDFVDSVPGSTHVSLDKYFLETPQALSFLDWVQKPEAIDWQLAISHIHQLQHEDCYSPAFDAWGTNKRLSEGGSQHHPRSLLMKGGSTIFVVPGCLAFLFPDFGMRTVRVFIDTSLETIAQRLGKSATNEPVEAFLNRRLTADYPAILGFKREADIVVSGEAARETWADTCQQIVDF